MLKSLEINGFKSFEKKSKLKFQAPISAIVGPNGSGKSNAAEAFRFVLGEQSLKSLRASHSNELLFNGGTGGRKANRAHVKAAFDNTSNDLDIDYDEVVIERIIERDDASTYRINGSRVRLKDITELLSDANIGTSGHHIISQGETDRVLSVSERQRKSIIEDALGLRRLYSRRREALRKLEKTKENLATATEHQKEIKPQLDYLRRQRKRIEKTKEIREELTELYRQFFKRESVRLSTVQSELKERKQELEDKENSLKEQIKETKKKVEESSKNTETKKKKPDKLEERITKLDNELGEVNQKYGEVTGTLNSLKEQIEKVENKSKKAWMSAENFSSYREDIESLSRGINKNNPQKTTEQVRDLVTKVKKFLAAFEVPKANSNNSKQELEEKVSNLKKDKEELDKKRGQLKKERQKLQKRKEQIATAEAEEKNKRHKNEKELVKLEAELKAVMSELEDCREKETRTEEDEEVLSEEKSEARVLCDPAVLEFEETPIINSEGEEINKAELSSESRQERREFMRKLERLKLKLEETRVHDQAEVLKEFEHLEEKNEFLTREISDLENSRSSLSELVEEIEETAEQKFRTGISSINKTFAQFFATMFGGGSAELFITKHPEGRDQLVENMGETPENTEQGVGIKVKLPNKKIRGLEVLSGGERVLVSIALLFALSQINPPPFIVLDEADAALDEANSRRFGEMIETLSDKSQLVIITHNRETMRRADHLYGVTMDKNGGSRLLSINLSEAMKTVND